MFGSYGYTNNCSVLDLNPGRYFCTTTVSDLPTSDFWFVEIVSFIPNEPDRIIRAYDPVSKKSAVMYRINNVWTSWQTYVTTSDLGYIVCDVDTSANSSVVIPDAPNGSLYIPVVIGHWSANNVLEHVFFQSDFWYAYSSVSQHIRVRFYRYPM